MPTILIAEAGSSKTNWSLLFDGADKVVRADSNGINPLHDSENSIRENLQKISDELKPEKIDQIIFYGAGCAFEEINRKLASQLSDFFNCREVEVESDMMAAARALFGSGDGIACILGTGSNSCNFSRGKITEKIPSLGYILGDEGSGVALGKALLNAVFKLQLPKDILDKFHSEYYLTTEELIKKVYTYSKPAAFLASFSPFLYKHRENEAIRTLLRNEFESFFLKMVLPYKDCRNKNIGMVGSVAFHYKEIILETALHLNLKISSILKKPIEELEKFHCNNGI